MFKFVILLAVIAAAAAGPGLVATPLLGRLVPQPSLAPANTEHAGYLSGLTPVAREYISYPAGYQGIYPGAYSPGHIPLAYASNYVAYSAPVEASHYQIGY